MLVQKNTSYQKEKMDAESSDDARQGKERAGHKSKSAAMEEIWSESQQMVQEAAVGLPYHRPTVGKVGPNR